VNGRELEHVLSMIEENISANQTILRSEVFRFIKRNEDEVVAQLRKNARARIPTSFGEMILNLADLHKAVA
jgi:Lhr-like helicase